MPDMDSFATSQLSVMPALDVDGTNWPMFKKRFHIFMHGAELSEHYSEDDNTPADRYDDIEKKPIKKDQEADDEYKKHLNDWKEGEAEWKEDTKKWRNNARAMGALRKVIPALMFMDVADLRTFREMWNAIEEHIKMVTEHQKSNLRGELNQMVCSEKANVREHLDEM